MSNKSLRSVSLKSATQTSGPSYHFNIIVQTPRTCDLPLIYGDTSEAGITPDNHETRHRYSCPYINITRCSDMQMIYLSLPHTFPSKKHIMSSVTSLYYPPPPLVL